MKRRLILMRHAQSGHGPSGSPDHQRTLTEVGRRDAARIGQRLAELGWTPEAAISSDSTRTRQTWENMVDTLVAAPEPHFSRSLYCAGPNDIWTEAHHLPLQAQTALCLGHNPGWEHALHLLTGQGLPLTPATAALLEGEGDSWPAALELSWRVVDVLRPNELSA